MLLLNTPEGNILAVPFKIGRNDPENSQVILSDIKKVYHQNNFEMKIKTNLETKLKRAEEMNKTYFVLN